MVKGRQGREGEGCGEARAGGGEGEEQGIGPSVCFGRWGEAGEVEEESAGGAASGSVAAFRRGGGRDGSSGGRCCRGEAGQRGGGIWRGERGEEKERRRGQAQRLFRSLWRGRGGRGGKLAWGAWRLVRSPRV